MRGEVRGRASEAANSIRSQAARREAASVVDLLVDGSKGREGCTHELEGYLAR